MKREFSAGVIIFVEEENKRKYLVLHYPKGHWDLPKGKIEKNETKIQAAHRELKEETNLEAEIIPGFEQTLTYNFRSGPDLVKKDVTFFLGKPLHKNVILSEEHLDYRWLTFEEAIEQLTFQNAKQILALANEFIVKN